MWVFYSNMPADPSAASWVPSQEVSTEAFLCLAVASLSWYCFTRWISKDSSYKDDQSNKINQ